MNNITLDIDESIINIFSSEPISKIMNDLNNHNTKTNQKKLTKYYEVKQIHSNIIHIIDNNYINNSLGDALITNKINTPIIIKVADCVPILLYDKENKVIALIHSGWKGTLENIIVDTIKLMINKFKSKPESINVYIYPSIRKCHFEVEEDVYSLFKDKIKNINKYVTKSNNKYYISLQSIIKDNLIDFGVTNIIDTSICTYCNHDKYYSYRYNHTEKRNILLAMIKE